MMNDNNESEAKVLELNTDKARIRQITEPQALGTAKDLKVIKSKEDQDNFDFAETIRKNREAKAKLQAMRDEDNKKTLKTYRIKTKKG